MNLNIFDKHYSKLFIMEEDKDLLFEKEVADKLLEANYEIFSRNLIIKEEKDDNVKCEIDILLYKTIIECKYTDFKTISDYIINQKLERQLNRYSKYFPDFTVVLWFKTITEEDRLSTYYTFLQTEFPNVILTDSIKDLKTRFILPKQEYVIRKPHIIWSFIAKNGNLSQYSFLENIKCHSNILRDFVCFVDDPIEKENFIRFKSQINIVNDIKEIKRWDIEISTTNNSQIERSFNYNKSKFILLIPQIEYSSIGHPMYLISGFQICMKCNKITTNKKMKGSICKFCLNS
jgi:hypothetical protein